MATNHNGGEIMTTRQVSISEASRLLSWPEIRVRRAIRNNTLRAARKKTPQGFVYSIDLEDIETINANSAKHDLEQRVAALERMVAELQTKSGLAPGLSQLAGVTVAYFDYLVSHGTCERLALAHGYTRTGAKTRIPDDVRDTPQNVVAWLDEYAHRPTSRQSWHMCDDDACPCHNR